MCPTWKRQKVNSNCSLNYNQSQRCICLPALGSGCCRGGPAIPWVEQEWPELRTRPGSSGRTPPQEEPPLLGCSWIEAGPGASPVLKGQINKTKLSVQVLYLYKWKMSYIIDNLVIKKYIKRSKVTRCLWRPATGTTHLFVKATDVCLPSTHCNIGVCECADAHSRCSHWCDDSDTWLHVTVVTAHICTLRVSMTTDILSRSLLFSTTSYYKKRWSRFWLMT